ncbi:MAG: hypothetical protein RLZZ292_2586, partial [Bacteroidota bacterium]
SNVFGVEGERFFLETTDGMTTEWHVGDDDTEQSFSFLKKIQRIHFQYIKFLKKIKISDYDYVYIRHFLVSPLFLLMLWRMKKQNPRLTVFLEIPTYPYIYSFRYAPLQQKIQLWIDQACTPFFRFWVNKIVTYAADPSKKIYGIDALVIQNGIDAASFSRHPIPASMEVFHVLGVANVQPWHGFDRFLRSLAVYYQTTQNAQNICFHIVGNGPALPELKRLTTELSLEKNVIFHGATFGEKLDNLFKISHLGIGVLGMCRTDLSSVSSLKGREYTVRGLPFVQDCPDDSFPSDFPFIHWISMDEELISIPAMLDFYTNLLKKHPDYPNKMYAFAQENLTWARQLQAVVDCFC